MVLQCIATVFLLALVITEAAYLPTYLGKCSFRDRRINDCMIAKANQAIPRITKGDPYYDIPYMTPLFLPEPVVLRNDRELRFIMNNVLLYGLEKTQVTASNFSYTKAGGVFINPVITILANYEINGKLLNTPIYGVGSVNITLDQVIFSYAVSLPQVVRDGEAYFTATNPKATYESLRTIYKFDNLYNGDEYLGAEMNRYLNKNWKQLQRVLQPAGNIVLSNIITTVLNGICNNVPINNIFDP